MDRSSGRRTGVPRTSRRKRTRGPPGVARGGQSPEAAFPITKTKVARAERRHGVPTLVERALARRAVTEGIARASLEGDGELQRRPFASAHETSNRGGLAKQVYLVGVKRLDSSMENFESLSDEGISNKEILRSTVDISTGDQNYCSRYRRGRGFGGPVTVPSSSVPGSRTSRASSRPPLGYDIPASSWRTRSAR